MKNKISSIVLISFYVVVILAIILIAYNYHEQQYLFDIREKEITMIVGDSYDLDLVATDNRYQDAVNYNISDSKNIVSFDGFTVNAKEIGETIVTVKSKHGKTKKEVKIKVIDGEITDISTDEYMNISIEDEQKINVTLNNDESIKSNIKYESSNDDVVKVDEKGNVTAVSEGNATIKVIYSDEVYTYVDVNVNNNNNNNNSNNNNSNSNNNNNSNSNNNNNNNSNNNNNNNSNNNNSSSQTPTQPAPAPQPNNKVVYILKDTSFERGFQMVNNSGPGGAPVTYRSCDNDSGSNCDPYFYLYNANNYPNMTSYYTDENGWKTITALQSDGSNDKLFRYKNGEFQMQVNTYGKTYSPNGNTWPHLLITGATGKPNGLSTLDAFNKYVNAEDRSYYYLTNDNLIMFEVDVRLDFFKKGNPINGVQASQVLAYLEIYDELNNQMYWMGFNLFDDRGIVFLPADGSFAMDEQTKSFVVLFPSINVFENQNTIYNYGNIVEGVWKHVKVDITQKTDDLIYQLNAAGIHVDKSKLRIGGFNIGYEIHGEYWIGTSFKNLSLISKKR